MSIAETAGIRKANEGLDGITWSILGQTYVPKSRTDDSFSWHATFRPAPLFRRTFIRTRTNISICSKAN
jgi:hypothetical protein